MTEYKSILNINGVQRGVSPFLFEDGDMYAIQNFSTTDIGTVKKSGDYSIKNAQISAGQDVLGGIDFFRSDGTHEHIVAVNGDSFADIYKDVAGTWTIQNQNLAKDNKVRFAYSPALDTLFSCNWEDATRYYNGTAWNTDSHVTGAPKAKFIMNFGQRIYLLYCDIGGTEYVSRMYRSSLVIDSPLTWDLDLDYINLEDTITGVGKSGENLFIGCQNSCWMLSLNDDRYQVSGHGCVSHDGIAEYGSAVFFPSYDGMYLFDGSQDLKISAAVQDYWDAIPNANLGSICAKVNGDHLYVYIGDISADGRTLINVVLDYNILQNNWSRLSLADAVKDMHTFTESTGIELFFGNDDGEVFQLFTSGAQNTAAFSSYLETPWYFGTDPRTVDEFTELWVHGDQLSGLKVKCKVDDGNWEPLGEVNGSTDVLLFSKTGKKIKFLLEEASKSNLYEVYALDIGYTSKHLAEKVYR